MHHTSTLALLLASGLILTGCAGSKVAVINAPRIYQESEAGKAGLAYLEQVEKDIRTRIETAQKTAESMSDNETVSTELQKFFVRCQEAMTRAQQEAVTSVQEHVNQSLQNYREANNITAILQNEAIASVDPAADVTDDIIEDMNRTGVSFEPVKIDDFVVPAAPDKKQNTGKKSGK